MPPERSDDDIDALLKLKAIGIDPNKASFIRMLVTYGELSDQIAYQRNEMTWKYLDQVTVDHAESKIWENLPAHQREIILTQASSITRMLYES